MSRTLTCFLVAAAVAASFYAGSQYGRPAPDAPAMAGASVRYACPMHPQFVSDKPGTAPCCGMRLEPVAPDGTIGAGGAPGGNLPPGVLHVSGERRQMIGIRTGKVERTPATHILRAPGRVVPDEDRTHVVNAAVDGWIRRVYPRPSGSVVQEGEPLATFYSKDFLAAQQNYFYALNTLDRINKSQFTGTEQASLTELQVWANEDILEGLGMGRVQVKEIAKTREFVRSVVIRAPVTGFLLERNLAAGQRFQKGQELYRSADLSHVWVLADVFENEARYARPGSSVRVHYQKTAFPGRVSEVPPQFDANTRSLKVRIEMTNPRAVLRPGMFVDAEFPIQLPPSLSAPADAVLDSGIRKTVFVDLGDGHFEPRTVQTGWRLGDRVEITDGLREGERIVVSGNFLLDSESRMKAALAEPEPAHIDPVCGMTVDPRKAAGKSEYRGKTYYFCNRSCKERFDKEPGRYLDSKSGERSMEAAEADPVHIDPVCGMKVDPHKAAGKSDYQGKTYYFCNKSCKERFDKEPGRYLDSKAGKPRV